MPSDQNPKISVITPSLNNGKYLRETIESIYSQSFQDFEHIVVDGGSTDETIDILKSYPQIRWISEKETDENTILEAYRKAFAMTRGKYIIQCCVSDGFLSKNWFKMCNDTLDSDNEIALVYGLAQSMTEEGSLGKIVNQEFMEKPPPQKKEFLPFWLAYGYGFHEANYCMRHEVFDDCFPQRNSTEKINKSPHFAFLYNFNTKGYLPYFLPVVANFCRYHSNQRGQALYAQEDNISNLFMDMFREYRKSVLQGSVTHYFRNGLSEIIGKVKKDELGRIRRKAFSHYIRSKIHKRLFEIISSI
jgi:glycosyltransferase involved in cell wall biosynthesis